MKKIIPILLIAFIMVTGCTSQNAKIQKWDNSKYATFSSSVGINVFNEHSFNNNEPNEDIDSYKANNTLYVSDLSKPITVKFNNNGKDRNFVMNVYYDYQPIKFKINKNGHYEQAYKFDLTDGHEVELPLYLPDHIKRSGAHKLMITFCIGYDIYAKELNQLIKWYGATTIQDVIFKPASKNVHFDHQKEYERPTGTSNLKYDYTLNQDYDYRIQHTGIMPSPPVSLTVKPKEKFKLIYNVSYPEKKAGQVLLMATIGFKSSLINKKPYLLIKVPENRTAIGEINLAAPEKPGLYELISYSISSPFDKIDGRRLIDYSIQATPRFTLEVKQ
jgi:hypothetical protein